MRKVFSLYEWRVRHVYFIFLLPVFFVLHGLNEHFGKIPTGDILKLLLIYILAVLANTWLFSFLFRSYRKAAAFAFALFFIYFFYGTIHDWLKSILPGSFLTSYSFIIPFLLLAYTGLFIFIIRTKREYFRLVAYLNILLLTLVIIEIVQISVKKPAFAEIIDKATKNNTTARVLSVCDTCNLEDIHLIILDEYAGQRELKDIFQFDNSVFTEALEERGFYVVNDSRSNYNYTELSTASLLSMDYLHDLYGKNDNELYYIGSSVIKKSVFTTYLEKLGYEINNYSIFDVGETRAPNRHFLPSSSLITDRTLLSRLKKDIGFHLLYTLKLKFFLKRELQTIEKDAAQHNQIMKTVVDKVSLEKKRPQFYYTHLLLPHVPYYFNKKGRFIGLQHYLYPGNQIEERKAYLEYLQYSNERVLNFVDGILKNASRPPIIIVMSDHGYRHDTIESTYHFSTLNAVYFPDKRYNGFYSGMSNVNQLRVLLNNRFHQKLPLLKDTSFYLGKGITYH